MLTSTTKLLPLRGGPDGLWGTSRLLCALVAVGLAGCVNDEEPGTSPWEDAEFRSAAQSVVDNYGAVVAANYGETVSSAEELAASIDTLLADPKEATLADARAAWRSARAPYGETEVYRFYDGPIEEIEGRINAWPLDEAYIDYVVGDEDAGLIADPEGMPTIDAAALSAANEALGEDTISTGWHAVEFLLWGQDLDAAGPGARPYTDFIDGPEGTGGYGERRRTYLAVVTDLLVDDLKAVDAAWAAGEGYRASFTAANPKDAVQKMLLGMGSLSGAELAGERMTVAFETREQEDEHSCFSDNTRDDLVANARGIENVYLGRYGAVNGPGLSELVARLDPELDARMRSELAHSVATIESIPAPFDAAIQAPEGSPARASVEASIEALRVQTSTIVEVADLLEIELNLES